MGGALTRGMDYGTPGFDEFQAVLLQKSFAKYIGMKPSNLSKVIKGERPVNNDLAMIFARLFNHDPMLWIEIQAKNEMNRIRSAGKEYETYSLGELLGEQQAAYLLRKKK